MVLGLRLITTAGDGARRGADYSRGRLHGWALAALAAVAALFGCDPIFLPQIADLDTTPLEISPAAATLAPYEQIDLVISGGTPPYLVEVDTRRSAGGGTLDDTRFTAGDIPGARDILRVADAAGRATEAAFTTGPALAVTPPEVSVAPLGSATLTIVGGLSPYTASLEPELGGVSQSALVRDGRTLSIAVGTAGNATDLVTVRDATGRAEVVARVVRTDALSVAPRFPELAPGQELFFVISGGQPPYALDSITIASGAGSAVSLESAAVIHYGAGATGDVNDRFVIGDANGAQLEIEVQVLPALQAAYLRAPVPDYETDSPLVLGGKPPYTFSHERNFSGSSLDPSTGFYRPGTRSYARDVVRVTDALGQFVDVAVAHYVSVPTTDTSWDLAAGDLDGDTFPDLVASLVTRGQLEVFRSSGAAGGFQRAAVLTAGMKPRGVAIADIDGDTIVDIVNVDELGDALYIHYGLSPGNLTFEAPQILTVGAEPRSVTVVDLDVDGVPEILVPGYGSNDLTILRPATGRTFTSEVIPVLDGPRHATATDDGAILLVSDVHIVNPSNCINETQDATFGAIQLLEPDLGSFVPEAPIKAAFAGWEVDAADLDSDGDLDALYPATLRGSVCFIWNVRTAPECECVGGAGEAIRARVVDIEGDGRPDVVVLDPTNSYVTVVRNVHSVLLRYVERVDVGRAPWNFALADFNGDGLIDIATANAYANDLGIAFGTGRRKLGEGPRLAPVATPLGLTAIENTDAVDVFVASFAGLTVERFRRDRTGIIQRTSLLAAGGHRFVSVASQLLPTGETLLATVTTSLNAPVHVAVIDSGPVVESTIVQVDLAIALTFVNSAASPWPRIAVSVKSASPGGGGEIVLVDLTALTPIGAQIQQRLPTCDNPERPLAYDFDGDGDDDLAVPCSTSDEIYIWLAADFGTTTAPKVLDTPRFPSDLAAADFDGDGNVDLVVTCVSDDVVARFAGDGAGGFLPLLPALSVSLGPDGVASGDLDGDAHVDLVVAARMSNELVILWGDGTGQFPTRDRFRVGLAPRWPVLVDFDLDGRRDVVVANQVSDDVTVLYSPSRAESPL